MVTDDAGMPVSRFEYLPYGETWVEETADDVDEEHNPKYNSQELDRETNFYYYNARHYDPVICRFVTADTVVPNENDIQSWNRYSYVRNNPIIYKDPTGHQEDNIFDLISDINNLLSKYDKPSSKEGKRGIHFKKNSAIWEVSKTDKNGLKGIADKINLKYNLDVTVDDILAANNNIASDPKHIIKPGDKINLSFLNIERSYTLEGSQYEPSVLGNGPIWGKVNFMEKIQITNLNSDRQVSVINSKTYKYSGGQMGWGTPGVSVFSSYTGESKKNFSSFDDAIDTFFNGYSLQFSATIVGGSRGQKSKKSEGRWITGSTNISTPINKSIPDVNAGLSFIDKKELQNEQNYTNVINSGIR